MSITSGMEDLVGKAGRVGGAQLVGPAVVRVGAKVGNELPDEDKERSLS